MEKKKYQIFFCMIRGHIPTPFLHHYKVLGLTIKKDWIYETPHKFKQEPENYKIWIQIFFYLLCVCVSCGFWSMFTYIISFDSHNNSMRQTGVITLHFIEKHIEILKD